MYTITLNDGTVISGLTYDRNIFFSENAIDPKNLRGKLNPVTITSTETDYTGITGEHKHMELCYVKEMDGKYAFALADIPDDRWEFEKLRANQEYIAMMSGIQL